MKEGSHIFNFILLTSFPTTDKSCDFQADIIQFYYLQQGEHILMALNTTVRYCSPSVQNERRLTHIWNSYSCLLSSTQISPMIFRLISFNLTIYKRGNEFWQLGILLWNILPPLFNMKGGSHIFEIHTPDFFRNNR